MHSKKKLNCEGKLYVSDFGKIIEPGKKKVLILKLVFFSEDDRLPILFYTGIDSRAYPRTYTMHTKQNRQWHMVIMQSSNM